MTLCAALTAGYPALAQTAPRFDDAASFVVLGNGSVTNSGATQDLQKIDFIGWYDEGLARLLETDAPRRRWWRWILIQLNLRGVQLLLILLAVVAALIAYRYYYSTSDTHFRLASSDASAIVLLVENHGGQPSTLLGDTFAMQFGRLPVEPEGLVPVEPDKAITIPGYERVPVRLTFANILTPRKECDGAWCTKDQVSPRIPRAAIVVTGKVRESDDRVRKAPTVSSLTRH